MSQNLPELVHKLVKKIPIFDDVVFWILVNVFVLAYVGAWQLIFHSGPSLILSALAVVTAMLYILLARRMFIKRELWTTEASLVLPVLILLGDLIATGGVTAFSIFIAIPSLLLIFYAYRNLREET